MQHFIRLSTLIAVIVLLTACLEDSTQRQIKIQDFTDDEFAVLSQKLNIERTIEPISSNLPIHMGQNRVAPTEPAIDARAALLGRVLFYDNQLSITGETNCASCHLQSAAFSDNLVLSEGINGQLTKRNSLALASTPSFSSSYGSSDNFNQFVGFFWDERVSSIAAQSAETIENEIEMGHDLDELAALLNEQEMYRILARKAFGQERITEGVIVNALEVFTNSIISGSSRFDRLTDQEFFGPNTNSEPTWTPQEQQGRALYNANCASCHSFDMSFPARATANNGLDVISEDRGKGEFAGAAFDGIFKVPFLRNIEITGPYMHDGRFATLEAVIDHYNSGIQPHVNLSQDLIDPDTNEPKRMNFSTEDKAAIIAFLKTVTDDRLPFEERLSDPFK